MTITSSLRIIVEDEAVKDATVAKGKRPHESASSSAEELVDSRNDVPTTSPVESDDVVFTLNGTTILTISEGSIRGMSGCLDSVNEFLHFKQEVQHVTQSRDAMTDDEITETAMMGTPLRKSAKEDLTENFSIMMKGVAIKTVKISRSMAGWLVIHFNELVAFGKEVRSDPVLLKRRMNNFLDQLKFHIPKTVKYVEAGETETNHAFGNVEVVLEDEVDGKVES